MISDDVVRTVDPTQLKTFEDDIVWRAFVVVVKERVELVRNELETGVATVGDKLVVLDYEGLKKRQGECEGLRFILNLPGIIKEIWDQDKQDKSKEEE